MPSEFVSYNKTTNIVETGTAANGGTLTASINTVNQTSVQKIALAPQKEVIGTISIQSNQLTSKDVVTITVNDNGQYTEDEFDQITAFRSELATLADSLKLHPVAPPAP